MDDELDNEAATKAIETVDNLIPTIPQHSERRSRDILQTLEMMETILKAVDHAHTAIKRNLSLQKDRDKWLPPRYKRDVTGEILEPKVMLPPSGLWALEKMNAFLKMRAIVDNVALHGLRLSRDALDAPSNFRSAMLLSQMHSLKLGGFKADDIDRAFKTWVHPISLADFSYFMTSYYVLCTGGAYRDLSDSIFKVYNQGGPEEAVAGNGPGTYTPVYVSSESIMGMAEVKEILNSNEALRRITEAYLEDSEDYGEEDEQQEADKMEVEDETVKASNTGGEGEDETVKASSTGGAGGGGNNGSMADLMKAIEMKHGATATSKLAEV